MSKNINVNPDHYKVAGRERQGHAVPKASKSSARNGVVNDENTLRWQQRQRRQKSRQK
jgi:hypothetical protein